MYLRPKKFLSKKYLKQGTMKKISLGIHERRQNYKSS